MKAQINIGHEVNGIEVLDSEYIIKLLESFELIPTKVKTFEKGESEATTGAEFLFHNLQEFRLKIKMVAYHLAQDCISVLYPDDLTGELLGEKADKWGEFNPSYFQTV